MHASPCSLRPKDAKISAAIEIAQHPKPCQSTAGEGHTGWDGYDQAAFWVWVVCPAHPVLSLLLYVVWSAAKDVGRRLELVVMLVFLFFAWVELQLSRSAGPGSSDRDDGLWHFSLN